MIAIRDTFLVESYLFLMYKKIILKISDNKHLVEW